MLKASMSRALSEPPQPRPMSTPQRSSGMFTQVSAAQGRNDLWLQFPQYSDLIVGLKMAFALVYIWWVAD